MLPPSFAPPPKPIFKPPDDDDEGPVDSIVAGNVTLAQTQGMLVLDSSLTSQFNWLLSIACNVPCDLDALGHSIGHSNLCELTEHFLFEQLNHGNNILAEQPAVDYPSTSSKFSVFHSAVATFYAPSDESGSHGMCHEQIWASPLWCKKMPQYDTALVVEDKGMPGIKGLQVVRVKLFFSFSFDGVDYLCALVEWFSHIGSCPDPNTGLWKVRPKVTQGQWDVSVIHLDSFFRGTHLLPIFDGDHFLPHGFHHSYTLDSFHTYFVNKCIDNLAHEMLF